MQRTMPYILRQLRALKRRLPPSHPQFALICQDEKNRSHGYNGEVAINFYLADLADDNDFFIYHGLRLPTNHSFFQMDTLILTRSFLLIIEIKALKGSIYFDPVFKQMIRTFNGKVDGFRDPIVQVKRQNDCLSRWRATHRFLQTPIEDFVTFSNPETILKTEPGNSIIPSKVCHMHQVPDRIQTFTRAPVKIRLTDLERDRFNDQLLRAHTPLIQNVLELYHLTAQDLITGVQCPSCRRIPMNRIHSAWHCSTCGHRSKDAHLALLDDYFLLVSNTITNREFRHWAHLSSPDLANDLLKKENLTRIGNCRSSSYRNPELL
ncbi:nuclease-related domain-containing protein [Sporolactobacillus nakayamae]|nr:nuclease-related domain-containing protein [Sporolactobacillus nakayamae]